MNYQPVTSVTVNFNPSAQRTKRHSRGYNSIHKSLQCCSLLFFQKEQIHSGSDLTDAIAASVFNSFGAAIVVFKQTVSAITVAQLNPSP